MLLASDDGSFAEAVQSVQRAAATCGVPVLLVGAYARDLLLRRLGVGGATRRTRDVDFGVRVENWTSFRKLGEALLATEPFLEVDGNPHKVSFQGRIDVDLVPFGGVATADGRLVCWPDDFQREMNVLGYQEALDRAERCPIADVPMVTLPAFVGLKILSWNDGPHRRAKDAIDIAFILKSLYSMDHVLGAVCDMPDEDWDDIDRRCQRWLGGQVGSVFEPRTRAALGAVLVRETDSHGDWLLARQMAAVYPRAEEARRALAGLCEGLSLMAEPKRGGMLSDPR